MGYCAVSGKWPSRGINSLPLFSLLLAGMREGLLELVQPLCGVRWELLFEDGDCAKRKRDLLGSLMTVEPHTSPDAYIYA